MTVLLAVQAADGMVLIADGRTTKVDARPGEAATDKVAVVSDETCKLVAVPNAPVAVMLSGRSTFAKVPAAEATTQILNDALDSLPTNELTIEWIAKALHLGFIALVDQTDDPGIKTKPEDIVALVAGYDPAAGDPRSPKVLRVWAGQTDGVEPGMNGDPQGVWREGDFDAREDVVQEVFNWSQDEVEAKIELSGLPFARPDTFQRSSVTLIATTASPALRFWGISRGSFRSPSARTHTTSRWPAASGSTSPSYPGPPHRHPPT